MFAITYRMDVILLAVGFDTIISLRFRDMCTVHVVVVV